MTTENVREANQALSNRQTVAISESSNPFTSDRGKDPRVSHHDLITARWNAHKRTHAPA
jgi:hypothetical protein